MNSQYSAALEKFVSSYWPDRLIKNEIDLQALSGDAGFRRYYRAGIASPAIAVDSPPAKERNPEYVHINLLLEGLGVRVPKIYAVDFTQGYFLLEDLGSDLFLDQLVVQEPDRLYQLALDQLSLIQSCQDQPNFITNYDRSLLLAEMNLFCEWFLKKLLGLDLSTDRSDSLNRLFEELVGEALAQPRVLVHRDFHARNLMCLENGDLAVIDFQDAVWGPITYDLVSLARDCYVCWSKPRISRFVDDYADKLLGEGVIDTAQRVQFRRWFDLMGLQRHIKVLGIFARLHLRDGKPGYLADLPLVLRYTLEVMGSYDEFAEVATWMKTEIIPLCEQQPWYSDWRLAGAEFELA